MLFFLSLLFYFFFFLCFFLGEIKKKAMFLVACRLFFCDEDDLWMEEPDVVKVHSDAKEGMLDG